MIVTWLPSALADLDQIGLSAARHPNRAADLVAELYSCADTLAQMPRFGSVVPEYDDPDFREILKAGYRVVYRIRGDRIRVVSVTHGSRNLPRGLEKF